MASNKNIFYATNPAHTLDALWQIISTSNVALGDILIFLPSRRAVRAFEKMLVEKCGGATILPELVALGEGIEDDNDTETVGTISNLERTIVLAKLLSGDDHIKNISTALPIARDFIRMTDYFENEGIDVSKINWLDIIDEKYASHFQNKAKILQILSDNMSGILHGRMTTTAKRNADIRAWIPYIKSAEFPYKLAIVCGSTASVSATADVMETIAQMPFGRIILSGKIAGRIADFELETNPYHAEYKFLSRIGIGIQDIIPIDVGDSKTIDFMNFAFGNDTAKPQSTDSVKHCHLVECEHESMEAAAVAEIAADAIKHNKSVLVITPDAAGNQRIAREFVARNIPADFSGGQSAATHVMGRAILNMFDDWCENDSQIFDTLYNDADNNLFEMLLRIVESNKIVWSPGFDPMDKNAISIWVAIRELSNAIANNGITLSQSDARAFIADTLSGITIRRDAPNDAHVCVLGTIESRMQTADVVILTGLNDGMFPARGYENAWLPQHISQKIGLPSPNRKISLMSLDFMNLSCGPNVYWIRSKTSGGTQTTESRFLSRISARGGQFDTAQQAKILSIIHEYDNVKSCPLNYDAPTPPADWSDMYVTDLEYLIHNPYAYYVRHILRLSVQDDYWAGPDARDFGMLVHDIIEHAVPGDTADVLVKRMDDAAKKIDGLSGVQYRFWHKRFTEIAPLIVNEINAYPDAFSEITGSVKIADRTIRARADRICDGVVMDIKTGPAPTNSQLTSGTMPQLPIEAYILQSGGFKIPTTKRSKTPIMRFLQLRNNDSHPIEYDAETTAQMIRAAIDKTTELVHMFSVGRAPYENRPNSELKYRQFDDLARAWDDK